MKELGELCGLLPGMAPTSEQLHLVVMLSAGMGDAPLSSNRSPTDQLKEALSSNEAFKKHYLVSFKQASDSISLMRSIT